MVEICCQVYDQHNNTNNSLPDVRSTQLTAGRTINTTHCRTYDQHNSLRRTYDQYNSSPDVRSTQLTAGRSDQHNSLPDVRSTQLTAGFTITTHRRTYDQHNSLPDVRSQLIAGRTINTTHCRTYDQHNSLPDVRSTQLTAGRTITITSLPDVRSTQLTADVRSTQLTAGRPITTQLTAGRTINTTHCRTYDQHNSLPDVRSTQLTAVRSTQLTAGRWYRGTEPVTGSTGVWTVGGSLVLGRVGITDAAQYTCVANNTDGVARVSTHLLVTLPLSVQVTPREVQVDAGGRLELRCHVSGEPVDTVTWYKDGHVLRSGSRVRIRPREALHVAPVDPSDAGIYQVEARTPNPNPVLKLNPESEPGIEDEHRIRTRY
ncbi:Hemicentin-2-like 1 [Homarus americanus]|uniref:Hemicentin-2-like 1 n=1 Tax=Homarus americanus TaxID=6706 RepID=A0A8J5K294_HOMAM|nr:Hemicentin-2-like 1 [Homarus americanus]